MEPTAPKAVVKWKSASLPLLVTAAVWSGLSFWLYTAGHQPSGPSPFSQEAHYAIQAAVLPLAFVFAFFGATKVIRPALRAAAVEAAVVSRALTGAAFAMSGSVLIAFLLPDIVGYSQRGFTALGPLLAVTAPLVLVTTALSLMVVLVRSTGISWVRGAVTGGLSAAVFFFLLSLVVR